MTSRGENMQDIVDLFDRNGIKKTHQRLIIIQELQRSKVPVTAEYLHMKHTDMSLSTIYRTLELFCEKGITQKSIINESDRYYYEMMSNNHRHYVVCLGCSDIAYVDICPLHDSKMEFGGFEVTSHKLELYGYCKKCQIKQKKRSSF